jgi:aldehyde:ferredoxin oxidoreductase
MILVDYSRCTGCRTCETVCSAYNHPKRFNAELLNGAGNPYLSNIKVYGFNPDVDVPTVCAMCPDNSMHVKGHELAAHNCHANPPRALCYATAHRGGCHLNGTSIAQQNLIALADSMGLCLFAMGGYGHDFALVVKLMSGITGATSKGNPLRAGERIYNLEKLFNYREGFTREDDVIPDRFFEEPLTIGDKKGAVLNRDQFKTMMDEFYTQRGWHLKTSKPLAAKSKSLELAG